MDSILRYTGKIRGHGAKISISEVVYTKFALFNSYSENLCTR
jgi:hypothetical protein